MLQGNEAEFPIQSPYRLSREEREALEQEHKLAERKAWLSHSYMIGDKILDCEAGENFGVQPILLASGYGKEEKRKLEEEGKPCPPYLKFRGSCKMDCREGAVFIIGVRSNAV